MTIVFLFVNIIFRLLSSGAGEPIVSCCHFVGVSVSESLHPLLNTGQWSQLILNEVESDGNRLPYDDKGTAP